MSELDERKRVTITQGMANAMGAAPARVCGKCSLAVPKYPGRYPSKCPACGGKLGMPKPVYTEAHDDGGLPVVAVSYVPRLQAMIESGVESVEMRAPGCSRPRSIAYAVVERTIPGGINGLTMFLEGPQGARFYRTEGVRDPVLIFEFDDPTERVRVYATTLPEAVLGFDPRAEMIADGLDEDVGATVAQSNTRKSVLAGKSTADGAQRAVGRYRFELGANRKIDPRIDLTRSMQNARNSRRGLANRIRAAKDWHTKTAAGSSYHKDLARFNKGNHRGQPVGPGTQESMMTDAQLTEFGPGGVGILPTTGGAYPEQKTLDDVLDAILRKLITIESQDILQDIEITREGAIFLYFDPSIADPEMAEVLQVVRSAEPKIELVGTPDGRLPTETFPAQWWVLTLPPNPAAMIPGPPPPKEPEDDGEPEAPKQQMVVQGKTTLDQLAADVDTDALVQSVGGKAEKNESRLAQIRREASALRVSTKKGSTR